MPEAVLCTRSLVPTNRHRPLDFAPGRDYQGGTRLFDFAARSVPRGFFARPRRCCVRLFTSRVLASVVMALVTTAALAAAQSGTASLSGRVTDAQGQIIPGATVTVNSAATG